MRAAAAHSSPPMPWAFHDTFYITIVIRINNLDTLLTLTVYKRPKKE